MEDLEVLKDIQRGERLFQKGNIKGALDVFESVIEKDPENIYALNDMGVVLNKLGRYSEAIEAFQNVMGNDKHNSPAVFNLISNYLITKNFREAKNTFINFRHCLPKEDAEILRQELDRIEPENHLTNTNIRQLTISVPSESEITDFRLSLNLENIVHRTMWNFLSSSSLYEPETSNIILDTLKPGDSFIDIGAHIGYFSLLAATLIGPTGKVFSVEPEYSNFNLLEDNISLNKYRHIRPFNLALGLKDEERDLYINSDNDGGHALWDVGKYPLNNKSRSNPLSKKINVVSLDNLLKDEQIHNLRLIKIDTEGAELDILKGGRNLIGKYSVPYILCEINRFGLKQMGTNEGELRAFLQGLGYDTYLVNDDRKGTGLIRLNPDQFIETQRVFNVLFVNKAF